MINEFNIGNILQILQILVILSGGLFFLYQIKAQLIVISSIQQNLGDRLRQLEVEIKQLAEVTIDLAKQGERMTALDLRMTNLSTRIDDYIRLTTPFLSEPHSVRRQSKR
jgi:hypothetical protein